MPFLYKHKKGIDIEAILKDVMICPLTKERARSLYSNGYFICNNLCRSRRRKAIFYFLQKIFYSNYKEKVTSFFEYFYILYQT